MRVSPFCPAFPMALSDRHDPPALMLHHRHIACIAPDLSETYSFILRDHIEHVAPCIEGLFRLCWRDVSDGSKQPTVVEPIDPAEGCHFQFLHVAPRSLAPLGDARIAWRAMDGPIRFCRDRLSSR